MANRMMRVLQALEDYQEKHKYSPTVRELAEAVGLVSSSSAHDYLNQLKSRGLVQWDPGCPRTLRIVKREA